MISLAAAVSVTDRTRFVSLYDDAIDYAASDLAAYADTLDASHLAIKDGAAPTYFILRPCSQVEVRRANTAVAARTPDLHNRIAAIGGELLRVGLVGAENLISRGDKHDWPQGCPLALLDCSSGGGDAQIPAIIQESIAVALYRLSEGPASDGGLGDEKKSRSPSSLSAEGTSTKPASSAKPAKAKKGGGAGAQKRQG